MVQRSLPTTKHSHGPAPASTHRDAIFAHPRCPNASPCFQGEVTQRRSRWVGGGRYPRKRLRPFATNPLPALPLPAGGER